MQTRDEKINSYCNKLNINNGLFSRSIDKHLAVSQQIKTKQQHIQMWFIPAGKDYASVFHSLDELKQKNIRPKILSLGCGLSEEIIAIQSYFDDFEYIGIDNTKNLIELCNEVYKDDSRCTFILSDASNYELTNKAIGEKKFDIVFLLHPPLVDPTKNPMGSDFIKIIRDNIPKWANGTATVFASFHGEDEYERYKKMITNNQFYKETTSFVRPGRSVCKIVSSGSVLENPILKDESKKIAKNHTQSELFKISPHDQLVNRIEKFNNVEIVLNLIKKKKYGSALRSACTSKKYGYQFVQILLEYRDQLSIDINEQAGEDQFAAIHYAVLKQATTHVYELLLKYGANENLITAKGKTAKEMYLARFPAATNMIR